MPIHLECQGESFLSRRSRRRRSKVILYPSRDLYLGIIGRASEMLRRLRKDAACAVKFSLCRSPQSDIIVLEGREIRDSVYFMDWTERTNAGLWRLPSASQI